MERMKLHNYIGMKNHETYYNYYGTRYSDRKNNETKKNKTRN